MPSVINTNTATAELHFDKPIFYSEQQLSPTSSTNSPKPTVHELKENNSRRRQQWSDPDDEFSAPIHTEFPLITKKPLEMSSFLLNHRTMQRSIEIMTPPSTYKETSNNSAPRSQICPTIPDGPFYIHHRSTPTGGAFSNVVTCSHVNCYEHNHHSFSISRPSTCQNERRLLLLPSDNSEIEEIEDKTSKWQSLSSKSSAPQQKHSFLESHIASIDQWLSSKAGFN